MLLIDTSAWIDHLSRADSPISRRVARAVRDGEAVITDQVLMEVLAGTTDAVRLARWTSMLTACRFLPQRTYSDASAAAALYRTCRRAGETPRNLSACLIAAVALRHGAAVLHNDRDFDALARHCGLESTRS